MVRPLWLLGVALLLVAGLAGCMGEQAPDAAPPNTSGSDEGPALTGFSYACPDGETTERGAGVCVGTLSSRTESYQEVVAASEEGTERAAVAAIEWRTDPVSTDGATASRIGVFVTEDGGASWAKAPQVPAPRMAGEAEMYDPSLDYGPDGVLHLNAMWVEPAEDPGLLVRAPDMYQVASAEPAEGWEAPALVTADGDADRGWVEADREGGPVVAWQNLDTGSTELAWLDDGWQRQDEDQLVEDCAEHTPPRVLGNRTFVGCVDEADGAGLRVFAFDDADGSLEQTSTVDAITEPDRAVRPRMTVTSDGSLVVAGVSEEGPVLASSPDGLNWSAPLLVFERVSVDDGWEDPSIWAMRADPWGGVHLVVRSNHDSTAFSVDQPAHELAHVALDPDTWTVLAEQPLSSWDPQEPEERRVPGSTAPSAPDDTAGLAFFEDHAMAFWSYDRAIDYTVIEPVLGDAPAGNATRAR